MRKKILLPALAMCVQAYAISISDVWKTVPLDILPYLSSTQKSSLVEYADMGLPPNIKNSLGEVTAIDTLTQNYMKVSLSKASTLQLRLLPTQEGDTVICAVHTFKAPQEDSTIKLYKTDWTELQSITSLQQFVAKTKIPDSIRVTLKQYDPLLLKADLSVNSDELQLTATGIEAVEIKDENDAEKEEKGEEIKSFLQINLKWDGKTFK